MAHADNSSFSRVLRIGSFTYAPYHVFKHGGLDAPIQGVCGEILKAVVSSMRMRYDLIQARDPLWGLRKEDGNWTGLIGMVQRDEVDVALSVINPSDGAEKVAFGSQIFVPIELVILAGRLSRNNESILDTTSIFSWQVWACVLGAILVLALVISSTKHICRMRKRTVNKKHPWVYDFYKTVCELIANLLCEASAVAPTTGPARIVMGAFWVLVIVMATSFAGQMKASMMVKKEAGRVDSIRDIARRPSLKPYMPQGSSVVSSIRGSQDPSYQRVWRMAQHHASVLPIRRILTPKAMREAMRSEAVLISSRASHVLEGEKACAANDTRGELYVGRTPCYTYNAVLYLNKRLELRLREAIGDRWDN
ncbi:glutamate receptor ionotropic, delta-2-like [Dermacentor andersoni]|uniref:glutamate receptor ionotropic, delta-2-like n=1 Tax=Dermacentor andersoni TaxID=34620 RepID=UPI003B3B34E9